MTPCVAYIRVSTERQATEVHTSLADQQAAIEQLAVRLGVVVQHWYRDEGASGASVEKRPALLRLLADCEAANVRDGLVLALNDSRWGRFPDPEESAYWRHHLRRHGWTVRFCEGDDSENKTARSVMRAIGAAQATEYRDNIRRNARRGMRGAAEQGYWTRRAPFGYKRMVVYPPGHERVLDHHQLKAPDEKVRLTPDSDTAPVVRWAFEQYASGMLSAVKLVGELKLRAPVRKWSARHVQAMLLNPAYCGDVVGGRRPAAENGVQKTTRPVSEWYGMRDAHEPIVPRALWLEVQHRLSQNARRGKAVYAHYLLSGLMTCTHCGEKYIGGGGGRRTKFYKCGGGGTVCPGRIGCVTRRFIDDAVVDVLSRVLRSKSLQTQMERAIDAVLERAPVQMAESVAEIRAQKRKAEAKRDRLVAFLADGTLQPHEVSDQLEVARTEVAELESRLEVLRFRGRATDVDARDREAVLRLAHDFAAVAQHATGPELRALVEPWLDGATFDKVTRQLTLRIRPLPLAAGFQQLNWPGQATQMKALVRRVSLAQAAVGQPVIARQVRAS